MSTQFIVALTSGKQMTVPGATHVVVEDGALYLVTKSTAAHSVPLSFFWGLIKTTRAVEDASRGGCAITDSPGEEGRPGFPYCETCHQLYGIGPDYDGFRESERRNLAGRELVLMRRGNEQIIVDAKTGLVEMDEAERGFESWESEEANIRQIEAQTPAKTPRCPKCGSTSVTIHVDADATYELKGWNKQGEIVADFATPADVATYDDRHYECDGCSFNSSDAEDFAAE